SLVSS
ncbi:polysaccharide biosynthesis family protein, partial [Vibrio parahaemolyticus V-223/04]